MMRSIRCGYIGMRSGSRSGNLYVTGRLLHWLRYCMMRMTISCFPPGTMRMQEYFWNRTMCRPSGSKGSVKSSIPYPSAGTKENGPAVRKRRLCRMRTDWMPWVRSALREPSLMAGSMDVRLRSRCSIFMRNCSCWRT